MTGKREATTMSVREMREILGIKKTESYWLIKKHYFDTVKIAGRMRIVKKSFESWYANQIHYRKVQGEEPGIKLRSESYSAREIGEMLGITTSSVYDLIQHAKLKTVSVNYQLRVPRTVFEAWYGSQNHYRNAQDRERDRMIEEASMTVPEMGRLLGIDRRAAWKLHTKAKAALVTIRVAGKPRITKESFEQWYQNQSEYRDVYIPLCLCCQSSRSIALTSTGFHGLKWPYAVIRIQMTLCGFLTVYRYLLVYQRFTHTIARIDSRSHAAYHVRTQTNIAQGKIAA